MGDDMERLRAAALELSGRVDFVTLSLLDEGGGPESRLLFNLRRLRAAAIAAGPAALAGFATYLGTNTSSRKVALLRRDGRASLYYADYQSWEGCNVSGRIEELDDKAVKAALWTPDWEMYYHGGLDGGDFSVLKFTPERVRYYHGLACTGFDA